MLLYVSLYNDWLSGKINLLGAPDTVIPFYSSFYMTNSISNLNLFSWNFYNQTDFAYAHMSTGWWTTSGLVTAIASIIINYFFEINGQNFLQIHLMIIIVCQLFLRLTGMILLMKQYNLKNSTIIIATCLVSPLVFGRFSLSYHVSIIYSSIFLLIYLINNLRKDFSLKSLSKFLMFTTAIVFQQPLFAIAYLGQIIFCYIIFQLIGYLKNNRVVVKKSLQNLKLKLIKPHSDFPLVHTVNSIYLILTLFIFYIWSKSIISNYFFLENRAQSPLINLQTLKILVGTQWAEDLGKILNTTSTGMVSGWPFMGITLTLFSILGLIGRFDRNLSALRLLVSIFILMQFSIHRSDLNDSWNIFDLPSTILKILGAISRTILYITFPFSFLFRSGTMLVWLIASILIIFFAVGLDRYAKQFSQRLIDRKYLIQVSIALVFIIFLSHSVYVLLTICIGLIFSIFFYFKSRKCNISENISRFVILTIISIFLFVDLMFSSMNAEDSEYTGTSVVPNSFVFDQYSTPYFVPQYVSPFSSTSFQVLSTGSSPEVSPPSEAPLLAAYRDSNYFGPNELNSFFYQTIYMGNYKFNSYYQNKNILFSNYQGTSQPEYLPTVIQNTNRNGFNSIEERSTNKIEIGTIFKVIKNTDGSNLYVFNSKHDTSNLRSSFDPELNTILFDIDGKEFYPVKGKPISENSFDFGNFYSGKLTFVSKIKPTSLNTESFQLTSSNNISNNENTFLKSEIVAGGIKINNTNQKSNSVTFAIPFQTGWKINPTGDTTLLNSNGWLKAENLESKTYHLEFNPYSPLPYYAPFLLLVWSSFIFFLTPFNLLNSKVFNKP
jgi:hypothetical protein